MAVNYNRNLLSNSEKKHLDDMTSVSWGLAIFVAFVITVNVAAIVYWLYSTGHSPAELNANRSGFNMSWLIGLAVGIGVTYHLGKPASDDEVRSYLKSIGYYERAEYEADGRDRDAHHTATRSSWERGLASWVKRSYPSLHVIENDRSTISSRQGTPLELDILLPDIGIAIEANGEQWHDHMGYDADRRNGTCNTEEMYKERQCAYKGITLIHVWDSQTEAHIHRVIDDAISTASSNSSAA